jgi:transmembrane protein
MLMSTDGQPGHDTPALVARVLSHPVTLLFARICLALPFLEAGVAKLFDWSQGEAEMTHVGLHPAWLFNVAALCTELAGSTLVVVNRGTWIGAGALGIFTLLATLLAHRFWEFSGTERNLQLNSFLEHAAICAAFILVVTVKLRTAGRGGL